jgi:hypothetical protein
MRLPGFIGGRGLRLRFEQRECVIVPQTRGFVALHADVHFVASARRTTAIDDAFLVWRIGGREYRRSRWDRAVVDGRFRYPPQPLAVEVGGEPIALTLTFTDALIPYGEEPPPGTSALVLELRDAGGRVTSREPWRVAMTSWEEPAAVTWTGGS